MLGVSTLKCSGRPFFARVRPFAPACQPAESSNALATVVSNGGKRSVLQAYDAVMGNGPCERRPNFPKTFWSIARRSAAIVNARRTRMSPKIGCAACGELGSYGFIVI